MRTLMNSSERTRIREVLREWGVPRSQIEAILRDGVFGPGTIGTDDEPDPGVGLMVDERRDPIAAVAPPTPLVSASRLRPVHTPLLEGGQI